MARMHDLLTELSQARVDCFRLPKGHDGPAQIQAVQTQISEYVMELTLRIQDGSDPFAVQELVYLHTRSMLMEQFIPFPPQPKRPG